MNNASKNEWIATSCHRLPRVFFSRIRTIGWVSFSFAVWIGGNVIAASPMTIECEDFQTVQKAGAGGSAKDAKYPKPGPLENGSGGAAMTFATLSSSAKTKPFIETVLTLPNPGKYMVWIRGCARKEVKAGDFVLSANGRDIGPVMLATATNDLPAWVRLEAGNLASGQLRIQRNDGDGYAFLDVVQITDDPAYRPLEGWPADGASAVPGKVKGGNKRAPDASAQANNPKYNPPMSDAIGPDGKPLPMHVVHSKVAGVMDDSVLKWPLPPTPVPMALHGKPVFPGAVGFGTCTKAGQGGRIFRVTTLDKEGPGSFKEALLAAGPRIIVFEVGGVIDLQKSKIKITNALLTVAGQTAPSPGITIIGGGIDIETHDVLFQHLRVRPGDCNLKRAKGVKWETDGICAFGPTAVNIVIDHCSVSWATDENLSVSGPKYQKPEENPRNITISHCLIAEGLWHSVHSEKSHSMGSLVHGPTTRLAIFGCLYAHNGARNPLIGLQSTGVLVNNFIYNPYKMAMEMGGLGPKQWAGAEPLKPTLMSVVGNVLLRGTNSFAGNHSKGKNIPGVPLLRAEDAELYLEDNLSFDREGKPAELTLGEFKTLKEKPIWVEGLQPVPAATLESYILATAGARPKDRDEVDQRILRDLQARQGQLIDSQNEVGGYPKPTPAKRPLQIPSQGMEEWLAKMAADLE